MSMSSLADGIQITSNIWICNPQQPDSWQQLANNLNVSGIIRCGANNSQSWSLSQCKDIDSMTLDINMLVDDQSDANTNDNNKFYSTLIHSFGFTEKSLKGNQSPHILLLTDAEEISMQFAVVIALAWLMIYEKNDYDTAWMTVHSSLPTLSLPPNLITRLRRVCDSIKEEFVDWSTSRCNSNREIQALFDYPIGDFDMYQGPYPSPYPNIAPLSEDVLNKRTSKTTLDKAMNSNNRLRKDQPNELIEQNEKECKLLLSGYYCLPTLSHVDVNNKVRLTNEFILDLQDDAIVNMANEALLGGGGMDMLIHTYAGESLRLETSALPNVIEGEYYYGVKCLTGDAKITSGHNLSSKYIIHVVTPYLDSNGNTDKRSHVDAYKSILKYVDGKHIRSLSTGPLSTGYYGYPMLEASILGLLTIRKFLIQYGDELVDGINLWIPNETQYKMYEYLIPLLL